MMAREDGDWARDPEHVGTPTGAVGHPDPLLTDPLASGCDDWAVVGVIGSRSMVDGRWHHPDGSDARSTPDCPLTTTAYAVKKSERSIRFTKVLEVKDDRHSVPERTDVLRNNIAYKPEPRLQKQGGIVPTTLEALKKHWAAGRFVCLGLDPQIKEIPDSVKQTTDVETIIAFNRAIIEVTHDVVAAYKPNVAFFESFGVEGWKALEATIVSIRQHNPHAVVILDAKRADIGSTNSGYVKSAFDQLRVDATTINPYFGKEALKPYLDRSDRMMFVLCRTSNVGAGEFQDLDVGNGKKLYEYVAERVALSWNSNKNLGLVVGATSPTELHSIRNLVPDIPLLIPGVGAQGGDVDAVIRAVRSAGSPNVLVNSSRAILYADKTADFATKAREVASELADRLAEGLL